MQINTNYDNLEQSYLFSTIARKVREYSASHPEADIIRLGIGDVTRPLVPAACLSARNAAADAVIEAGKNKSTECAMHSVLFAVLKDDGPVEGSQYRITT